MVSRPAYSESPEPARNGPPGPGPAAPGRPEPVCTPHPSAVIAVIAGRTGRAAPARPTADRRVETSGAGPGPWSRPDRSRSRARGRQPRAARAGRSESHPSLVRVTRCAVTQRPARRRPWQAPAGLSDSHWQPGQPAALPVWVGGWGAFGPERLQWQRLGCATGCRDHGGPARRPHYYYAAARPGPFPR